MEMGKIPGMGWDGTIYFMKCLYIVHSPYWGPGLVSSLEAEAAKWALPPIPSKARHYARTLKDRVDEC